MTVRSTVVRNPLRSVAATLAAVFTATFAALLLALSPAAADTTPLDPNLPPTVSADVLPTVQINGVVWDQVVVGDTVYATGDFTTARPAGAAPGQNETPRSHLLAYDITTGELITSWAPALNNQGLAIEASDDGSTIFVGGDFSQVDGQFRNRLVAIDAVTGAIDADFNPVVNTRVASMDAVGDTLYFGGYFTTVDGQSRSRLAAVDTATGDLLPWAPEVDREVVAMVVHEPSNRVIVGGSFYGINGVDNPGMGSVDGTTGAVQPWSINSIIKNRGTGTQISDLATDGDLVYGSGWAYFAGNADANFEGQFAADPLTGDLVWVNGCRGDTYGVHVMHDVLYTAGHAHDCGMVGGQPELAQRGWQQSMAFTAGPSPYGRTNANGPYSVWQPFIGMPSGEVLHWYPTFSTGSYTGTTQAGFTVEGNDEYLLIGGEFPRVNGIQQQGLVRFTTTENAPNADRPNGYQFLQPDIDGLGPGTVRLGWLAAFDRDNERVTYEILRGATEATSVVLDTFHRDNSAWWARPLMGFTDDTAPPGSTQTYRIRVTDPFGNGFAGPATTVTIPSGTPVESIYRDAVQQDRPLHHWRFGETSGDTAYNWSASDDLSLHSSVDPTSGAIVADPDGAADFDSTSDTSRVPARPNDDQLGLQEFSVEAWVRTTTGQGGKIIGFGNSRTGRSSSTTSDRNLYMSNDGRIRFGVRPDYGDRLAINSASGYNDGDWHHVVGTLDPVAGLALYVDGVLVDSDPTITSAQVYRGYWRVGGDRLSSWPGQPSRESIDADLDEVAVYGHALSAERVQAHHDAGLAAPVAGFTATATDLVVDFDGSGSSDNGSIVSYDWDFGDGSTGTGIAPSHTYGSYGTFDVTLTVTDDDGLTGVLTDSVTIEAPNMAPTAAFSATVNAIDVDLDATSSSDSDGSIVSYDWDFGDGSTGSGPILSHIYASSGTYTVTLTVTDDDGATGVTSDTVTTDAPPSDLYAFDDFDRIGTGGFGTAPTGGAWAHTGPLGAYSTDATASVAGAIGGSRGAYLTELSQIDTDLKATVALDTVPAGGDAYLSILGRRVSAGDDYGVKLRYRPDGSVISYLQRRLGGATTILGFGQVPGVTLGAGDAVRVRLQVTGTTTTDVRAKVWRAGTPEPETWTVEGSDTTPAALQTGGHVGALLFVNSTWTAAAPTLTLDDLTVRAPYEGTVPGAPTAAFTATATDLDVDFDASASADDGSIVSHDWDFGDATTGSGELVSHTYTEAGNYVVTLTVTDNEGNTATASESIFVTDGSTTVPFALDEFDRTVAGGLGDADLGGSWTTSGAAGDFSVSGGAARIASAINAARAAYLTGATSADTDLRTDVSLDVAPTGDAYLSIFGRRVSNGNDYRVKLRYQTNGQVTAYLVRTVGNVSTVLDWGVVPGVIVGAGDTLSVRLEVTGTATTDLALRVWQAGTAEPVDPTLSASETTPVELQQAGHVGALLYVAPNWTGPAPVLSLDHLSARPVGG